MLQMQHRMNTRVHEHWIAQNFEWYRAAWIECGELMDHVGYKWWKKQTPDMEQVRLEVVDIWHFGLSALFDAETDLPDLAKAISANFDAASTDEGAPESDVAQIHAATEALAQHALASKTFSVPLFAELMRACGLSADDLYRHYIGKNVLNFFRQDHGYQDGTYVKQWQGREDNEHLSELLESLDDAAPDFPEQVYQALESRYSAAS
ncbi:MAG: dUTP diphosphatase [Halieaceae bacterium]|nr:dUTP diphosphatase [Halieaceae bacterium]